MLTEAEIIPYLSIGNLKNHTLSRGTYLYSRCMGVPHPEQGACSNLYYSYGLLGAFDHIHMLICTLEILNII